MKLLEKLGGMEKAAIKEAVEASSLDDLEKLRVQYLGRKGVVTTAIKGMKNVAKKDKPKVGKYINELKTKIDSLLKEKEDVFREQEQSMFENNDMTLPGINIDIGHRHPLMQTMQDIIDIFVRMGFKSVVTPEVETEFYNFEGLNIPKNHPSRETFHTFYVDGGRLLRSQTSTAQIRMMEKEKPPIQVVHAGKVYRPDAVDASHSFMFYQIEGFMVDEGIVFSDLKGVLEHFAKEYFGESVKMRFRPHYFPFTEPSAEADISCFICGGKGCRVCSYKGWLEVLGAGMINPRVFECVKYDTSKYTGFAFGMGVDRICMLKHGIDDIRLLYENDVRFLKQF
ncbi:MAG: phenylalanine--tRNA ligase subunit alpha [Candidatus Omnitrophica bacterium]|nr:phenylalanine--tRNA ligase subunit alpha [Candidatus Omnitrophota bacterium]MBU4589526.1 phenylalanine--tRNA ligase subunit alpha [Candidatus Omnitrophota bacterium]